MIYTYLLFDISTIIQFLTLGIGFAFKLLIVILASTVRITCGVSSLVSIPGLISSHLELAWLCSYPLHMILLESFDEIYAFKDIGDIVNSTFLHF